MRLNLARILPSILLLSLYSAVGWGADWLTFGHDPQRSGWAVEEKDLSVNNAGKLELKWKTALKNEALSLASLTAPLVASNVTTPQGIKTLVYVAGSSNHLFALDSQSGEQVWSYSFKSSTVPKDEGMWLCPNNLNATPVIDRLRNLIFVISADGKLYGLDLGTGKTGWGPIQFVPPFAKVWSLNLVDGFVYTSTSQGCGGTPSGIFVMDTRHPNQPAMNSLLVARRGGGIWGRGGPVVGADGRVYAAVGDGNFNPLLNDYCNTVIAASQQDLKVLDYFVPLNWREVNRLDWDLGSTSPVWFAHRDHNLLALGAKEGVVYLLDADAMGEKDHFTPLDITPRLGNDEDSFEGKGVWGSLSAWQDDEGETWVYVPVLGPVSKKAPKFPMMNGPNPNGSVMAFKVAVNESTKKPSLAAAWVSGDFSIPDPVVIANGIVFALSTGENVRQTKEGGVINWTKLTLLTNEQRRELTTRAVLYALDARTGKVLYQSGNSIESWVHFSGLAVANGRVFTVDYKSNVYCFGLQGK
ncbi:MAG: PQQ-binding-like beta-propeller repeat protein [Terriglobia bacterium]